MAATSSRPHRSLRRADRPTTSECGSPPTMFTYSIPRAIVSTQAETVAPRLLALDVGGVLVESFPVADWAQNFATAA